MQIQNNRACFLSHGARWFIVALALGMCVGCAQTATPTLLPVPTSVPTPTIAVPNPTGGLPTIGSQRHAPTDVPACPGAQAIAQPIEFTWAGIEDVRASAPEANWTFYRCNASPTMLATFYQRWMPEPQYRWVQMHWEERGSTTLAVYYFSTSAPMTPNRWLYLWFVAEPATQETGYLVAAWWEAAKSC